MSVAQASRQLFDIELRPVAGARFQPTGFPDLGAATFDRPERVNGHVEWTKSILVESPQSIANWLEATAWDRATEGPEPALSGLPYVRVVAADDGRYLTSSRTEAHRLASAFVKQSTLNGRPMTQVIAERLKLRHDTPLAPRDFALAVAALDPLCLVHGVFFADKEWPGQPKVPRAVTGFVEAIDVRPAISGGVKRDDVRHETSGQAEGKAEEGYGFVPFHRIEYTAGRIVASFNIDLAQIRSYGLPDPGADLLTAVARWEIRSLLDRGLRLRTACDLARVVEDVTDRSGQPLAPLVDLEAELRGLAEACSEFLGDGSPTEVVWAGGVSKKRARGAAAAVEESS